LEFVMEEENAPRSQMLRLDSGLWKRISDRVSGSKITPRQDIERRLRESLSQRDDRKLSPARALARVVELHADDVASYCATADEWHAEMGASVPILLAELFAEHMAPTKLKDDDLAVTFAKTLAQKIRRAHLPITRAESDTWAGRTERALEEVQPSTAPRLAEEFQQLQEALHLLPDEAKVLRAPAKVKTARELQARKK
jgi:hypothetical protein